MKIQFFSRRNMMLDHCQNLLHFWEPLVCSVLFISGGVLYEGGDKWIRKDKMGILFSAWIQIAVLACLVKLAMVKLFACLTDFCTTEVEQPSLPPPNAPPPANPPPNVPPPANPPPNVPPPANPPPIQPIPCPFCGHVHQRNCTNATRQQREG